MMSTRRLILSFVLLACGFAAGLVITGRMHEAANDAAAQIAAPAPGAGVAAPPPAPAALPDFTRVAEQTVPAVANISSLQVVRRQNSPFNNDPFFQFFFGDGDLAGPRRGVERSLGSGVIVSADGLSLTNFRSFTRLDLQIPQRVVLLTGANAQGKTTLLEAIYFLAAFTSFQTHTDRQLINFIEAGRKDATAVARLVADFERGKGRHRIEARLILDPVGVLNGQRLRKEVLLDGVKKSVNDVIGHFNAVIFVPQMSQIIEGAPEDRRRYLNLALAQSTPGYARVLSEYNQALTQRNALLKALGENGGSRDQLEVWDEALTRLGSQIILWRIEAVRQIERLASDVHHELTHGTESLRLSYDPAFDPLPKPDGQLGLKMDTVIDRSGLKLNEIQISFRERLRELNGE